MKTLTRILSLATLAVAVLGMPSLAKAGTTFTLTVTPTADSASQGTAANLSYPSGLKATASGSYTGGSITLSSSVTYANGASPTPGITLTFPNNPFGGNASPLSATAGLNVATSAGTTAGTYTVTITGLNTSAKNATATYILTVTASGSGPIVWSPAGVNTNWSTGANWSPAGPPTSANDVQFYDLGGGAGPGVPDNYVDASMTIGSLNYGQTNVTHTTSIAAGQTLAVVDANGLTAGTGVDNGPSEVTANAITGATGTLIVSNTSAMVYVGQGSATSGTPNATLDMSGLGKFSATIARLLVGVDLVVKGNSGSLNLAGTNIINITPGSTAPQIDIGDNSQANAISGIVQDTLLLGKTNAFYVDSIEVGRGRVNAGGTVLFNSSAVAPSAYFRGTNGNTSRVGTWFIGDGNNGKGSGTFARGTNDFSLGTVDALVNTITIGLGSSATGTSPTTGAGTLNINAGSFNVNSLMAGLAQMGAGIGTINLTGGTLSVNSNLVLAAGGSTAAAFVNVSGGTLTANSGIAVGGGSANLSLTGGTLNVTNSTATVGNASTPLNNFTVGGATLNLVAQNFATTVVTTNLTINSPSTINVTAVPLLTGFPTQLQLIQYGVGGGTLSGDPSTFILGTLPGGANPPYKGYISNNVANNSIDLVITNGPFVPALTWDGTPTGNWDIMSTANWKPKSGPDTVYSNSDFVTFDDSLTGTTNVNLTTTVLPGSVTVNNSSVTYIFGGSGKISGGTALLKQGSSTLIVDNSGLNDFSGGTIINNGTVQVGNNDASGNLPSSAITDNGNLAYDRIDAVSLSSPLSGSGQLTQSGSGILTLTANNTLFNGEMLVTQGTLQTGTTNALGGTTNVIVSNGGTLDVNGQSLYGSGFVQSVTISGAGVGGNGALVNSGASQTKVLHILTLAADSTIGGSGDIEIRNSSGNSATADGQLNGAFNLTKTGTNNVSFKGVTIDPNLGNINVQAGSMTVSGTATAIISSLGNPSATATMATNATLTLDTIGNIPGKNFVLTNGGTLKCSATNTLNSPLTLYGPGQNAITVNTASQFLITTAIAGSGGFVKNGNSTLFLNAANPYTGGTSISGGTLALYSNGSDGSISSSTNVNIGSGGTLDVSGRSDGTFTLASGQTLSCGGGGTNAAAVINGNLTATAGSAIVPGTTNSAGALNITGNALLQGATIMEVGGTSGNDQLNAAALTYGGSLTVGLLDLAVTNGQTFQLFISSNGIYNASSFSSVTFPSAAGITWTNNLTVNGTITAGVVIGPKTTPVITHISITGTSLHINGTNGQSGATLYVYASTNLAKPLSQWTPLSTNAFSGTGTFNITNTVDGSASQNYFIIKY